jgi:hypothetical protein
VSGVYAHDLLRGYDTGPGSERLTFTTAYCSNPACAHARRPHPIRGVANGGSWWMPPNAGPSECPACDAELSDYPLFESDEPYVSEDWL